MNNCPFPQANNMELIYNIFFEIGPSGLSKYDITQKFGLTDRQGAYYLDSLLFIGLVEKINVKYFLNAKGAEIRMASASDTKKEFVKALLSNDFLGEIYKSVDCLLTDQEKKDFIASKIFNEYGLGINTSQRRASSIFAWLQWIRMSEDRNGN